MMPADMTRQQIGVRFLMRMPELVKAWAERSPRLSLAFRIYP
jgi:hypothetical protein